MVATAQLIGPAHHAAVHRPARWRQAGVLTCSAESVRMVRVVLDVPDWPGHLPGQRVLIRVIGVGGNLAQRSYCIAAASDGPRVDVLVDRCPADGVSPYLTEESGVGDIVEVRGPIGERFVWCPAGGDPVQLIGGGVGVAPLLAMLDAHGRSGSPAPMRLLYAVRCADHRLGGAVVLTGHHQARVDVVYSRAAPPGWSGTTGRIDAGTVDRLVLPAAVEPQVYVSGMPGFVETVRGVLLDAGHAARRLHTQLFGPAGTPLG